MLFSCCSYSCYQGAGGWADENGWQFTIQTNKHEIFVLLTNVRNRIFRYKSPKNFFLIDGYSDKYISQLINLYGLFIFNIVRSLLIKFNFQFVVL